MRKYWDDWGWVIALVIIVIGFLRILFGREAFCGPETEQCAREWLNALGGWAAVGAAVPTILFLSKQVRDADRQHREMAFIQLQRTRALFKRAWLDIMEVQSISESYKWAWTQHPDSMTIDWGAADEYLTAMRDLLGRLENPIFDDVEREVFAAGFSIRSIRRYIREQAINQVTAADGSILPVDADYLRSFAMRVFAKIKDYSDELDVAAQQFMTTTERLINKVDR